MQATPRIEQFKNWAIRNEENICNAAKWTGMVLLLIAFAMAYSGAEKALGGWEGRKDVSYQDLNKKWIATFCLAFTGFILVVFAGMNGLQKITPSTKSSKIVAYVIRLFAAGLLIMGFGLVLRDSFGTALRGWAGENVYRTVSQVRGNLSTGLGCAVAGAVGLLIASSVSEFFKRRAALPQEVQLQPINLVEQQVQV